MTGLTTSGGRNEPAPRNFVEHLQTLARTRPDEVWLTVAGESEGQPVERAFTYAAFERHTRALAARLQQQCAPGERALVMLDNDEHYAASMLACFYCGVIAVPVFPPESLRPQHLARLMGIAADSQAACVLTSSALLMLMASAEQGFTHAKAIAVDMLDLDLAEAWRPFLPADDDVAFCNTPRDRPLPPRG